MHPLPAWVCAVAVMLGAAAHATTAQQAAPAAADPALEARVLRVAEELRCLVCQNETIAASQAALAVDLRSQIREHLRAGRSDAQIREHMVERYGDFILYRPPWRASTLLLWLGPFALLLIALGGWRAVVRSRADTLTGARLHTALHRGLDTASGLDASSASGTATTNTTHDADLARGWALLQADAAAQPPGTRAHAPRGPGGAAR